MKTSEILDALKALCDDKIWASELALFDDKSGRRVDFWTLEPIRSKNFRTTAYEIKVSRQDFKNDSLEKQSAALQYSDRFWYATPPSLLKQEEIPEWAGLIEWNGKSFCVRRKPPMRQKKEPDWPFIVSLMRNCGDSRRDVGILKAELAFYRQDSAYQRKQQKLKNDLEMLRWTQKAQKKK